MRLDTVMVSSLFFIHEFDISPGTDYGDQAWIVRSDGVVFHGNDYVGRSYGKTSPDTYYDNGARFVRPNGDVVSSVSFNIGYSYGHKFSVHG